MSSTQHHFKQRQLHEGEVLAGARPGTSKARGSRGSFTKRLTHRLERLWPHKARDLAAELG